MNRNTKTYKERIVLIQAKMKNQLQKYIQIQGVMETDALFVTLDGEKMSKRQFQNRVTFYGKEAGIKGLDALVILFRHTFAKLFNTK
nr:tyrosine-type recombinase/integrase [Neobacillus fumarioli]